MATAPEPPPPAPRPSPTPTISVVMPVHDGERFLAAAIASIIGQTFARFELIVVDDGSTDGTAAILGNETDPRLRVHRLARNQGITRALNEGCRQARGQFIARMDADDVSVPERLEAQVDYLRSHEDVAVVGSWVQRMDEQGVLGAVQRYPAEPALVAWSMAFFNSVAHPTVLMRRAALDMAAVYSAEYPRAEDYALFAGLSRTARLANIPEVLLHYRMWSGNASRNAEQEQQAIRVVRDHARALGVVLTDADAGGLQGLARDRYPETPAAAGALARVVLELRSAAVDRLPGPDVAALIDGDAAVRLWLLAALSARRAPLFAASIAGRALRLAPASLVTFLGKVAGRLRSR
jgi:glycosyltransferase involved in cell wall biosynthesis